ERERSDAERIGELDQVADLPIHERMFGALGFGDALDGEARDCSHVHPPQSARGAELLEGGDGRGVAAHPSQPLVAERVVAGLVPVVALALVLVSVTTRREVRCEVAVSVAVVATRAAAPDATESVRPQVVAEGCHGSEPHVHPAPAHYERVVTA